MTPALKEQVEQLEQGKNLARKARIPAISCIFTQIVAVFHFITETEWCVGGVQTTAQLICGRTRDLKDTHTHCQIFRIPWWMMVVKEFVALHGCDIKKWLLISTKFWTFFNLNISKVFTRSTCLFMYAESIHVFFCIRLSIQFIYTAYKFIYTVL